MLAPPVPNLVLLDLNLPRKDGRSVLADVKSDPALRRIPVVIFSTSQAPLRTSSAVTSWGQTVTSANRPTWPEWMAAVKLLKDFWIGCACLPREENNE